MNFDINLGNLCNFRCKYCFESIDKFRTGKMTKEVANRTISFIDNVIDKHPNEKHTIYFWGGEPFLHTNRMEQFLEYYKNNKNIDFLVFTNGYFLKNYLDFIEKYKNNLTLQISYDFEPCNTLNRVLSNGKSVSNKIIESIKLIDSLNIKYCIKSTMFLNDLETHLYETYLDFYKFRKEVNNKNLVLSITPDTRSWEHWILDYQKIENQLKLLLKFFIENKIKITYMNWFDSFQNGKALCNSVKNGCMIDIDGKVYPCHGCSFMDNEYKSNFCYLDLMTENINISYNKFKNFIETFDISEPKECLECNTTLCYKCSAHNAIGGDKSLNSWNNKNEDYVCKMYKLISKYILAFQIIKNNNFNRK